METKLASGLGLDDSAPEVVLDLGPLVKSHPSDSAIGLMLSEHGCKFARQMAFKSLQCMSRRPIQEHNISYK